MSTNSVGDCDAVVEGGKEREGVMLRKVLNATYIIKSISPLPSLSAPGVRAQMTIESSSLTLDTTSAVSANVEHRCNPVRARKSSIRRVPILYPLHSGQYQLIVGPSRPRLD